MLHFRDLSATSVLNIPNSEILLFIITLEKSVNLVNVVKKFGSFPGERAISPCNKMCHLQVNLSTLYITLFIEFKKYNYYKSCVKYVKNLKI